MKNNRTRIDKLGESRMNIDRLKQNIIKLAGIILVMAAVSGIAGCGKSTASTEKVFYYGDTTFNAENDETDVNPHNGYSGWACIRYGVGETLFKYSDTMELEPWLAESYENVDELTWKINLKDGERFAILKKIGMERGEINASIHSQVLMVFFLPLAAAGIHSCFAFHLVKEILMGGFGLWDVKLLVLSAVLTFLAFAVFYVIVYLITAREYYKIVSE